jgi:hypothetical protein
MNIIERLKNSIEGVHLACYGVRMRWDEGTSEWIVYYSKPDEIFYPDDVKEIIYRGTDEAAATQALSDAGNK